MGCGWPDAGPGGPLEGIFGAGKNNTEFERIFLFNQVSSLYSKVMNKVLPVNPSNTMHHMDCVDQLLRKSESRT